MSGGMDDMGDTMNPADLQIGGGHYKGLAIQPSEYIHRNGIGWLEGNAIKYLSRHSGKGKAEDVRKAIHYAMLLLEWEYGERWDTRKPIKHP
jgi:hypothetical protein